MTGDTQGTQVVYSILVASVMTVRVLCVTGDTQGTQVVYSILVASVYDSQGVVCDRRHSGDTGGIQYTCCIRGHRWYTVYLLLVS